MLQENVRKICQNCFSLGITELRDPNARLQRSPSETIQYVLNPDEIKGVLTGQKQCLKVSYKHYRSGKKNVDDCRICRD